MSERRERVRAATMVEITQTARRILVAEGPSAVTLRAIAREMGMTAPALYRYFGSHSDLLRHLVGDLFTELTDELHREIKAVPPDDMAGKFGAACLSFRKWALSHQREYGLLFGTPLPGLDDSGQEDVADESSSRFGWTFMSLFLELWRKNRFPVMADEELDPHLREQVERYRERLGVDLPLGCMVMFLQCWVRLQGAVSLEIFGHLAFALDDPEPMFHMMITELGARLGLVWPTPSSGA